MALSSKGRRQREDLGKGRIALCHDDDGSSQVVADLCYICITPNNHRQLFCGRGSSSAQDQSLDRVRRPIRTFIFLAQELAFCNLDLDKSTAAPPFVRWEIWKFPQTLSGVHLKGVYLIGVHLIDVYVMSVDLIGVYLISVYLRRASHGCVSHKRASHRRTPHRCTFQNIYLINIYLTKGTS